MYSFRSLHVHIDVLYAGDNFNFQGSKFMIDFDFLSEEKIHEEFLGERSVKKKIAVFGQTR